MHYSFKYEGNHTMTASYGLKYAISVKANSFYDSGTSYLFALMLLRYVSDLFLSKQRVLTRCSI